jgi:3,4-dihydroxy 2-butanone 4-phosphate synthase/GTP cyclohydrolase II
VKLSPIPEVLERLRSGQLVILVDDEGRENEGDLVGVTEGITSEAVSFMMREGRGLICVTLSRQIADRLELPLQVRNNNSPFQTPFAIPVDHKAVAQTAVTAAGRAFTMRKLLDPQSKAADFVAPGHVFPLIANPAGVFGRRGQTEGSADLARLAGFQASGVICEILSPDGTMTRGEDLDNFAERHGLLITSIEALAQYRLSREVLVREVSRRAVTTDWGSAEVVAFFDDASRTEHLALVQGGPVRGEPVQCGPMQSGTGAEREGVLVRLHSECLTGDVFGSRRCDCGAQLAAACSLIREEGRGVVLYLRQEGRGIGLGNKVRAYALQDQGHDTVDANTLLGLPVDARSFAVAAGMLRALGIQKIRLLTNNPSKVQQLRELGLEIVERVPLVAPSDELTTPYLEAKRDRLGHLL